MSLLKPPLLRLASAQPEGDFFRKLYASMALEAGIQEDLFARASYLEGVIGATPGTLARNPRPALQKLEDDFASNTPNPLLDALSEKLGMSDNDIFRLVGSRDFDLFGALVQGATKAMPKGSIRGLTPQDVAMSIASGLSPITLKPLKYGPGKNVFYHLGEKAVPKVTFGGILAILKAEAHNRAFDIVRGTNRTEKRDTSLETPLGGDDSDATIGDFLANPRDMSRNVELIYAIFKDRAALSVVDREMRAVLSPAQTIVWAAIMKNPLLIDIEGSKLGVNNRGLAAEISEMTGIPNTRSLEVSSGKTFREKVWPAFEDVIGNSDAIEPLLKSQEIQDIIYESTHPMHMAKRTRLNRRHLASILREEKLQAPS